MIRPATTDDASRIAEISIFTKRMNYRDIFHDDQVSFGEMQVYPLAAEYMAPGALDDFWVFDDGFVKAFVHIESPEIKELYVDSFFASEGIGSKLIDFAVTEHGCDRLWVLEKNADAIRFYHRHGFAENGLRELQEGTPEYIIEMRRG